MLGPRESHPSKRTEQQGTEKVMKMSDAQREGFDNLDTANGLEREIKALSHEINEGLTRIGKMRSHLPDEYHRSFDAIVAKGYMPMIEAKRRTIKALELATDDLRGHARNVAGDASAA